MRLILPQHPQDDTRLGSAITRKPFNALHNDGAEQLATNDCYGVRKNLVHKLFTHFSTSPTQPTSDEVDVNISTTNAIDFHRRESGRLVTRDLDYIVLGL